ncbi:MAG: NAD-dependent epimerase/dehydratase family protein, partial [Phycisphaerae bacterium]|nr:NAD-dependent epimerase/dehydratase family protein [Phycisphaerae bacterium]
MPEAMRWCVTGASGQLGSVLARRLAAAGRNVLALSHRHSIEVGDLRTVPIDLTDRDATWRVLAEARPNVVVHLAAVAAVGDALNDPARARAVNVEATASLVDQADQLGA